MPYTYFVWIEKYVSLIQRNGAWFYEVQLGLTVTNGTPRAMTRPLTWVVGTDGKVPAFEKRPNQGRRHHESRPKSGAQAQELSPAEQAKKREEVRENLRQYQLAVIRAGMPALPIPLTGEMDDQLVEEGYLAPVDLSETNKLSNPSLSDGWTNSIPPKRVKSGIVED